MTTGTRPVDAPAGDAAMLVGAVSELSAADRARLFDRSTSSDETVRARTAAIIARVRRDGDAALLAMAREYDRAELASLEVPRAAWRRALDALDPALVRAMERARDNIERVHRAFVPAAAET